MKSLGARERTLAAVRRYEYDFMASELSHLEKLTAPLGTRQSEHLHSLENRPFAVRLLETPLADWALGWIQGVAERLEFRKGRPLNSPGVGGTLGQPDPTLAIRPSLANVLHSQPALKHRPNILLDLTAVFHGPSEEPANRAAQAMAEAAVRTGTAFPVLTVKGRIYPYYPYYCNAATALHIDLGDKDVLAVAGTFWTCAQEYPVALSAAAAAGAEVALVLHDVYALRFPAMYPADLVDEFERALLALLPLANTVVTTGGSANDLQSFLNSAGQPLHWLRYETVAPGVGPASVPGPVRTSVASALDGGATFVTVGALEPRNGHSVALDAFDLAWASGDDFSYAILGPFRWRSQSLRRRILGHPELNRRLFWINDPTDAETAYAYRHCRAAIVSSVAEADDLPVLAPALYGAPVIASDLASLRRAGGVEVYLFPIGSASSLAALIRATRRSVATASSVEARTWDDCIMELTNCLSPHR